jgi:hypothetical protein
MGVSKAQTKVGSLAEALSTKEPASLSFKVKRISAN